MRISPMIMTVLQTRCLLPDADKLQDMKKVGSHYNIGAQRHLILGAPCSLQNDEVILFDDLGSFQRCLVHELVTIAINTGSDEIIVDNLLERGGLVGMAEGFPISLANFAIQFNCGNFNINAIQDVSRISVCILRLTRPPHVAI
jgi:hypothetical protein